MSDLMELSHNEIEDAVSQLCALTGVCGEDMWAAVREQAGDERDEFSLSYGLSEVVRALQARGLNLDAFQPAGPRSEFISGEAMPKVPGPEARHLVAAARATPDEDFEAHLMAMTRQQDLDLAGSERAELPSGHVVSGIDGYLIALTSRNPGARKFFRPSGAAAQFLLANGYAVDEDDDQDGDAFYADQPGMGGPADILARARNGGLFAQKAAPATAEGGRGKHRKGCPPGCTRDHGAPSKGGVTHPEVEALMARHPDLLGRQFGGEFPADPNTRYSAGKYC